ncbi:MAG: MBL fold metallo-hydrolase [Candidatus Riflebacteria bacterium]|nr:MBL fold metallo-hydrolase [Candidatus Riflebacteria bacterium]
MEIHFINVGQGDSILVLTPKGKSYLIDGGSNESEIKTADNSRLYVQHYLKKIGIRNLDGVVVSHFHNDHLGGIIPVLKDFRVNKIWDCGGIHDSPAFRDYLEMLKTKKLIRQSVHSEDLLDWGEEIIVETLNPPKFTPSSFSIKDRSVVLRITYGKTSIILSGDIEKCGINEVLRYGNSLKSSILKIPGHGSAQSFSKNLYNLAAPDAVVLSVGKNNPFSYPVNELTNFLIEKKMQLFRTDANSAIVFKIYGRNFKDYEIVVDQ